jgi:hypothetical protein
MKIILRCIGVISSTLHRNTHGFQEMRSDALLKLGIAFLAQLTTLGIKNARKCNFGLISSQLHRYAHGFHKLHRNVHGFKKRIRKYISCSESGYRPNEPHSVFWTHENYISMHKSNLIHVAPKHARFPRNAFGSAFRVSNRVSGLINRFGR